MPVPRRQNLLFLGAVILPSVLVIALGMRMIRQENELAEKRFREQSQHAIDLVRQELLTRLEGIKLRAASGNVVPRDPDVALVARVESGRLVLPWDRPASRDQDRLLRQLRKPAGAAELLRTSPDVADEYGVPFAVYAARRMAGDASPQLQREILEQMVAVLNTAWLSPAAAHMVVEVAETLGAADLQDFAVARAREAEQAEQLARQALALDERGGEPVWRLFGSTPWLVRSSRGAAGGKVLIPRQKGGGPGSRFWLQVE